MDIFGKSGTQLLPMFADGAAGIRAMRDQADALGITISTEAAASAAKLNDALGTMWSAVKALTLNIGAALAPTVSEAADRISAVVASVTRFVRENKQLVVTVAGVAAGIGVAGAALLAIGGAATVAGFAASGLVSVMGLVSTVVAGVGAALPAVFSPIGLVITGLVAAAGAWLYFSGTGGKAIAWLKSQFSELVGFVGTVAGGIGDALMAGDLQLAARIAWSGIKVAFYRGVAELANVWNVVQTAAMRAFAAIQGAVSQVMTTMGQAVVTAFNAVTGFLGSTFSGYVQSGFAAASGLASAFGSFKTSTIESLSAIAKAMMHGEFAVAGEVAWTSIKLAFVQGIAWITNAWTEFTTGLAAIFDGVVVAIRTAWNNLTVFIGQLLMYQVARFQMLLDRLAQFDPTGLAAKLRSALDVNVGGTITAMEEDRKRFNRGLADAREKRDAERAAQMQARLAETEARLAELRRQREDALARARAAVDTGDKEAGPSPLAGAMDDLRKALAEAAAAPKLFDAGAASDKLGSVGADIDEMMLGSSGKGLSSQGTFSAAAVWGLAAGGVNERAAKAAEATAQNTRQLVDHARRGRLVFG